MNDSTKETNVSQGEEKKSSFLADVLRGGGMGAAFIIPGFSGGSVAAILGIYEKLVGAVAGLFVSFKRSFMTLLPIFLGLVIGVISLLFPLEWALGEFPFPTVSLFVGLTIGCMPSITVYLRGKIKWCHAVAFFIPFFLSISLSFLPVSADKNLLSLELFDYFILFLVGIIGSSALVIPGISGSMLLLILGYYNPIVKMITEFIKSVVSLLTGGGASSDEIIRPLLVLISVGGGIITGFIGISVIMKKMFEIAKRGTYFAIVGFILGSLPAVYVSCAKETGSTPSSVFSSPLLLSCCAVLLAVGVLFSYFIVILARKKAKSGVE